MMKLVFAALSAVVLAQGDEPKPNCLDFHATAKMKFSNFFFGGTETGISVDSEAPVFFPRNETELVDLYRDAVKHQCKVRVRGAGLSANGAVTQRMESNVVVIHLKDFVPEPKQWKKQLIQKPSPRVVAPAGLSWIEIIAMIRPFGYLMETQTIGPFFSVGGVIANSVVGGGRDKGFIYDLVTAMRVMKPNGDIVDVTKEGELRQYRGAYGLTGIILAVKLRLEADKGLIMSTEQRSYNFSDPSSWATLLQDQETMRKQYRSMFCSMSPYPSQKTGLFSVQCFVTRFSGVRFPNPKNPVHQMIKGQMQQIYQGKLAAFANFALYGPIAVDPKFVETQICLQVDCVSSIIPSAAAVSTLTANTLAQQAAEGGNLTMGGTNDGYIAFSAIRYSELGMFLPKATFLPVLQAYLGVAQFAIIEAMANPSVKSKWVPTGILTWRNVKPRGKSAFEFLKTNAEYLQMDMVEPQPFQKAAHAFVLEQVEQIWRSLGAIGHQGKFWGYKFNPLKYPVPYPFADANATAYTNPKAAELNMGIIKRDPLSIMSAGSQTMQLRPSEFTPFEPRMLNGRSCAATQLPPNSLCVSGCCCTTPACLTRKNTCIASKTVLLGKACAVDCECIGSLKCKKGKCAV